MYSKSSRFAEIPFNCHPAYTARRRGCRWRERCAVQCRVCPARADLAFPTDGTSLLRSEREFVKPFQRAQTHGVRLRDGLAIIRRLGRFATAVPARLCSLREQGWLPWVRAAADAIRRAKLDERELDTATTRSQCSVPAAWSGPGRSQEARPVANRSATAQAVRP